MSGRLAILGGQVADPRGSEGGVRGVYADGGVIVENPPEGFLDGAEVFDASGMIVMPGLIDMHVHFREPGLEYKEDIASGSRAAARGGFTTVCCMPNTAPAIDCRGAAELVDRRGKEAGLVNLLAAGALSMGQAGRALADFDGMDAAGTLCRELTGHGVCALSDDGRTLADAELMRRACERARALGLVISDHAEDASLSAGGVMNLGAASRRLGLKGIPNAAEANIVARDIALARETGCRIHIQHISTKESVELIRGARRQGLPVTAETAPHYFALTDAAVEAHSLLGRAAHAKMNPPLRSEADRLAVIEALRDGTVSCIATDHAPHSAEEKAGPIAEAPFGVSGLETSFAVSYTVLVRTGLVSLSGLARLMSANPAGILGLRRGGLSAGSAADIAVFDISGEYGIDSVGFASKGKNTPFQGMKVYGRAVLTVRGGEVTYSAI